MAISDQPGPDGGIEQPGGDTSERAGEPDPSGGGCMKFGWGCLPVIALIVTLPVQQLF